MRKSDHVQDERYVTDAWMRKSDHVQDERYVTEPWMRKSDHVQDEHVIACSSTIACIVLITYIPVTMRKRLFHHSWRPYITGALSPGMDCSRIPKVGATRRRRTCYRRWVGVTTF
jgi:hypothetical protein